MKIRPLGAELFHVDRRTYMTKVILAFRNIAKSLRQSEAAYHRTHIVRRTLSGVPFTQYDMLPQHQINIRNQSVSVLKM